MPWTQQHREKARRRRQDISRAEKLIEARLAALDDYRDEAVRKYGWNKADWPQEVLQREIEMWNSAVATGKAGDDGKVLVMSWPTDEPPELPFD